MLLAIAYDRLLKKLKTHINWEKKQILKFCTRIAPSTVWAIEKILLFGTTVLW